MRSTEHEPKHVLQVAELSLALFSQLIPEGNPTERLILEGAALLHDIGWQMKPDGKGHHKASERMILAQRWKHIPDKMVPLIANVARYHRKSIPRPTHPRFAALAAEDRQRVCRLAALLRVADALDRSHGQLVSRLRCRRLPGKCVVEVTARAPISAEQWAVTRKSDLFEDVFSCSLMIKQVDLPGSPAAEERIG